MQEQMSLTAQRKASPALMKEYRAAYYLSRRDQINAANKASYRRHSEARRAASRRYYADHRHEGIAARKAYYEDNKEVSLLRSRLYKVRNPKAYMLAQAKHGAKKRGFEFAITTADFEIPTNCPVFGLPLVLGVKRKHDMSPSLDRINNARGYVPGNVIVVSLMANRIKSNATPAQIQAVADFYSNLGGQK